METVSFTPNPIPFRELMLKIRQRCTGPEILAEVKVEVFRAKEAVTADNLRDRNNVQEYLLDKFEDGPYAVYEFSFKDGREPSQIASPISGHTTAPTSDTGMVISFAIQWSLL